MDNKKNLVAIEAMQAVIDEYTALIDDCTTKINHLKQSIILLGGNGAVSNGQIKSGLLNVKAPVNLADEAGKFPYPYAKKIRDKVEYIFNRENRFMILREVVDALAQIEPELKEQVNVIRNGMAYLKVDKVLINYPTGKSNNSIVWGKPEWLNEQGKAKQEHYYNVSLPEVN